MKRGTSYDFEVTNHGSVILFRPLNDAAREWIDENVQAHGWQWFGGALSVEPRYADNLFTGIAENGFSIAVR